MDGCWDWAGESENAIHAACNMPHDGNIIFGPEKYMKEVITWRHMHAVVILVHLFLFSKIYDHVTSNFSKMQFWSIRTFENGLKEYIRILWDNVICHLFECWLLVHLQLFERIKSAYTVYEEIQGTEILQNFQLDFVVYKYFSSASYKIAIIPANQDPSRNICGSLQSWNNSLDHHMIDCQLKLSFI